MCLVAEGCLSGGGREEGAVAAMSKEGNVATICRRLRKDPRHRDIVRLLKRVWEMLVQYDEGGGDDTLLGDITIGEVCAVLPAMPARCVVALGD
jgi:hypothetical protein